MQAKTNFSNGNENADKNTIGSSIFKYDCKQSADIKITKIMLKNDINIYLYSIWCGIRVEKTVFKIWFSIYTVPAPLLTAVINFSHYFAY